jgi:hypothetical protein
MVAVATKNSTNPLNLVIPHVGADRLQLPFKLLFPGHSVSGKGYFTMLGLGDIALPGIFLAFLAQIDEKIDQNGGQTTCDLLAAGGGRSGGDKVGLLESTTSRSSVTSSNEMGGGSSGRGNSNSNKDCEMGDCGQMVQSAPSNLSAAEGQKHQPTPTFFQLALIGYVVGLFAAIFASIHFKLAQPALLYLVPAMLVPVSLLACHRSQFSILWLGPISAGKKDDGDMNEVRIGDDSA